MSDYDNAQQVAPLGDGEHQEERGPGNRKLRSLSIVAGVISAIGLLILIYFLVWVEKLSGRFVFSKPFAKQRVVRVEPEESPSPQAPSQPGARPRRGPPQYRAEKLFEAKEIGPYDLRTEQNPFRCAIDVEAGVYAPDKLADNGVLFTYQIAMLDEFGNEIWKLDEPMPQEGSGGGAESSSYAMTVKVFDVPHDGEYTFHPRVGGPGVAFKTAKLLLRSRVQKGAPVAVLVGCLMFLLGLLVSISAGKAYELSRGGTGDAALLDPTAIGDRSLHTGPVPIAPDGDDQVTR